MTNNTFSQLPTVSSSLLADIFPADQGGVTVQQSLQQVFNLMVNNIILHFAGNPNGNVAGVVYQLCWDTTNLILYVCTTAGSTSTAVWTKSSLNVTVTPAQGGTGVASPAAHTLPVAEGASNFNFLGPLTNGQLLIGSTGVDPVAATLTGSAGISILNSAGSITISGSGGGTSWTSVSGTSQTLAPNNGYVANNGSLVTFTLPTTAAFGDTYKIVGQGSGGWALAQNSGQLTHLSSSVTTTGVGGSLASTNRYDVIEILCITANTEFTVEHVVGNITVV